MTGGNLENSFDPSKPELPDLGRRRILSGGAGILLASAIASPFLGALTTVKAVAQTTPEPAPEGGKSPSKLTLQKSSKKVIDPLFAKFLNEKLVYEVNFLSAFHAADLTVTLRQGLGEEILAQLEAKSTGVVSLASATKRQLFKSRLVVREIDGTKRLVATHFSRLSEKGGVVTKTIHHFDYQNRVWAFHKFVNAAKKEGTSKRIPADVTYYEDFVGFLYNLRAGVYGEVTSGKVIEIRTIPFKGIDRYKIKVATPEEMKEEESWIAKTPGAVHMGNVEIHEKIMGMKTGNGQILVDDQLVPLAGRIKDVIAFGDVSVTLVKRGKV